MIYTYPLKVIKILRPLPEGWYNQIMILEEIRQKIDQIDAQLVPLIETRMHLISQVARYKKETETPLLDQTRENIILEKVSSLVQDPEMKPSVQTIFKDIIAQSKIYQKGKID